MEKQRIFKKQWLLVLMLLAVFITGCSNGNDTNGQTTDKDQVANTVSNKNQITDEEVIAAQNAWAAGILSISEAYINGQDYRAAAQEVLDNLYGYKDGIVLFKPTLASDMPFRFTEEEALSYFVKGSVAEDKGFAINPWVNVRFADDREIIINGDSALSMGTYYFTAPDSDDEVRVEYAFGYYRDDKGDLRIQLHHSSVHYTND